MWEGTNPGASSLGVMRQQSTVIRQVGLCERSLIKQVTGPVACIRVISGIPRVLGHAIESKGSGRGLAASRAETCQERLDMEPPVRMLKTQCLPQGGTQIKCRAGLQAILKYSKTR